MLIWLLDRLGVKLARQETILKIVWQVMAVVFGCAFAYGIFKMITNIF